MVARGYASETFCYEAIAARGDDVRPYHVYYLGDFDRSGRDAANSLHEKLVRFSEPKGIEVHFAQLAVTLSQIDRLDLPLREPKRESAADKKWEFNFACELDALPPDETRRIVQEALERHLPVGQLTHLRIAEESERQLLSAFTRQFQSDQ